MHFREGDEVQVYCGHTRVLLAKRLQTPNGFVRIDADHAYKNQPCANRLFRRWHTDEYGFGKAIDAYLAGVMVNPRFTNGEGAVQVAWSSVVDPWVPFDREGVLGCPHKAGMDFPEVQAALVQLKELSSLEGWPDVRTTSRELDQLAVDN